MPNSTPSPSFPFVATTLSVPVAPVITSITATVVPGQANIVVTVPRDAVGGGTGATFGTPVLVTQAVSTVPVTFGGSGYSSINPPTILFFGGGGSGAVGVAVVSAGAITSVTVSSGGSLYTSPPTAAAATVFPLVNKLWLFWSLNPLPTDSVSLFDSNRESVLREALDTTLVPYPQTMTFTENGLNPGATYNFAAVAANT
jgi:hypothetical protein